TAECTPGYEGCACLSGACLGDLQCFSDLCVEPPSGTETVGEDEEDTNDDDDDDDDDESSGVPEVTATESSTSAPGESTDDGVEETTNAESTEESSTTEPEPECLEMDNYCANGMFQTCVGGQWEETTCTEVCGVSGYLSPGCSNADACLCEGFA